MINALPLLINNSEEKYRYFSQKLIPDTNYPILGVRAPIIKNIAKTVIQEGSALKFIASEHKYYEEWFLHGIILGKLKIEFEPLMNYIDCFIPNIDNWAICDSTVAGLKVFNKYPKEVFQKALGWIESKKPYTIRFGIVTLLDYFLDKNFSEKVLKVVANIKSDNYYVNMAIAWFFSVALVKQYEKALPYIENKKLSEFIHNKTIQKAIESFRIDNNKKEYLKSFRNKKGERNEKEKRK